MKEMDRRITQFMVDASSQRYSRRQLVQRGLGLGLSIPVVSGILASGAAAAPATHSRSLSRAQETTELSFYHDKSPWQDLFAEMGEMAAADIGVGFEPVPYSDTTSYQQVIQSALPTQEAPDFFTWWSGFRLEDLYAADALLDISDIWETAVADGDLPETLAAAFTFDDRQYAIPSHVSYWVTFYNRHVFDDNGLTVPETWDDLMAAAETLKGAGVTPFYANVVDYWPPFIWFEELLIHTDPDFYVAVTQGEASYTDATAVEAMETWHEMFENDYFTILDLPMDSNTANAFANGEFAMMPIGTWFQQQYIDAGMTPGEDYGAFILPNIDPGLDRNVMIVETGALCIPANAPNIDASKELAAWWVTPEAQTEWSAKLGDAPANPRAESDNPVLDEIITTIGEQDYELLQRYWEATPPPIVENAVNELARFMLNPDEYMSVLETIQELAEDEWARRE